MPSKPVVLVLHDDRLPSPQELAPVAEHAEIRHATEDELVRALPGAEVLFAYHFLSDAVPGAWHAADSLRWLHVAAAGVNSFLSDEVVASEVTVTNSRGVFDSAIAEYVLGQVIGMAKGLPAAVRRQQQHRWEHHESERVAGTTALVVGTGPIGRAIARLLRAVGIRVRGAGRRVRHDDPDFGHVCAPDTLATELAGADWVVAAAPLTDATRGMFDADAFAAMRPGARLVNVGRGELVRTDALVEALRSGQLAGAALDVVDPEPLPPGHPLWDLPGVVVTPHGSGDVVGWRDELVRVFVENFERWRQGRPLHNVVDKSLGYVPGS